MWEHFISDNQVFGCGKICYLNSITITGFVQTLVSYCWFENVFRTYFGIEILKFYMLFRKCIDYKFYFLTEAVLHIINFIVRWGMNSETIPHIFLVLCMTSYH
jgi:hypothetical protein